MAYKKNGTTKEAKVINVPIAIVRVDRSNPKYGEPAGSSIYDQARGAWVNSLKDEYVPLTRCSQVIVVDQNRKIIGHFEVEKFQKNDASLYTTRPAEQFLKCENRVMFSGKPVAKSSIVGKFYSGTFYVYGFKVEEFETVKGLIGDAIVSKTAETVAAITEATPAKVAYAW